MMLHESSSLWRRVLRRLGRRLFQLAENNDDVRIDSNGELWLLRQLVAAHGATQATKNLPFVACDAGANRGAYTRLVLQEARRAGCAVEVHTFEPSPRCLDGLCREFGADSAVHLVGAAVTDVAGDATLFAGKTGSSLASLVPRAVLEAEATETVQVPLMRLGDYLTSRGIAHLNLLKLDVEGAELAALRGLGGLLRPDVVDVIQFEYGGTALDAGTTLGQIWGLLTGRGYLVAKLFPRSLEVRDYRVWMENYSYANYVALAPRWRGASSAGAGAR